MESLYLLIPLAVFLVLIASFVFLWAVKNQQFEDLDRQGVSILFDDEIPSSQSLKKTATKEAPHE